MIYLFNKKIYIMGDIMTIENLINNYGSYIYNYALKLSCHPDSAEDLSQETFINAWKHIDSLENSNAVKPWLRKICLNLFLIHQRKKGSYTENLYDEIEALEKDGLLYVYSFPKPEDEIIVDEYIRDLQNGCFLAMVRKLTLNQRIAFSLIDMFGLSLDDVSNILNISKGAVKGLLYRAHMNLDSFFHNHCSIIDMDNPCSCKAWIEFSKMRNNLQKDTNNNKHKLIDKLDYKKSNYVFNEPTRIKVNYIYKNMPSKKPPKEWYYKVINSIKDMYI